MGMAFRMTDPATNQEYSFDPGRDIAYFWPQLVEMLHNGCLEKNWEYWYVDILKSFNVSEKRLLEAVFAYLKFCANALDPETQSVKDGIEKCGFTKCHSIAQLVVLAKIGQLGSGAFWAGIRHSTMQGVVPEPMALIQRLATELDKKLSGELHVVQLCP